EGCGEETFDEKRSRTVFVTAPALLHHHLDLPRELLRADHEVRHAVGVELDHEGQAVAVHLLVVDGEIRRGERVVAPARLRNEPRELAQTEAPGPLEHHVLEHVRDTGRAGRLVHAARSIPYLMNHGGRDRKSTRLNSSHGSISYAVFCLKKKSNIVITLYDRRRHVHHA